MTENKAQEKAHAADNSYMAKVMLEQANARGLGNEFRVMVEKLNEELTVKLPVPELKSNAYWQVNVRFDADQDINQMTGRQKQDFFKPIFEQGFEAWVKYMTEHKAELRVGEYDNYSLGAHRAEWVFPKPAEVPAETPAPVEGDTTEVSA